MTSALTLTPMPGLPAPNPLAAVDRAVAELRRGGFVVLVPTRAGPAGPDGSGFVIQAAEAVTPEGLGFLVQLAGTPAALTVTLRRARVLGLTATDDREDAESTAAAPPVPPSTPAAAAPAPSADADGTDAVLVSAAAGLDAEAIHTLAQPGSGRPAALPSPLTIRRLPASGPAGAAVRLAKLARLLPAAVVVPAPGENAVAFAAAHNLPAVAVSDIVAYDQRAARSLRPVSEARVPLAGAENTRIVAFRPGDGGIEHLAIIIGEPDGRQPVLTRLHSECFTGDLLGSLRCDCGDQLRGAIDEIADAGSGVLLYLAQEGRGIGLVNKLRAYQLQDQGFDTLDANGQLGFDDDERIYLPAAEMLRQLGFPQVRLLTNNPRKVEALARHGVAVIERVAHVFPANDHNLSYLRTKATRSGHLF